MGADGSVESSAIVYVQFSIELDAPNAVSNVSGMAEKSNHMNAFTAVDSPNRLTISQRFDKSGSILCSSNNSGAESIFQCRTAVVELLANVNILLLLLVIVVDGTAVFVVLV